MPPSGTDAGAFSTVPDAATSPPACVPDPGPDVLDSDFADTNCDGIDGDASTAVFVAPSGTDDAAGSRDAPVRTLARAVALAGEQGKPAIYACVGSYPENLKLSAGIEIHGGFDCEHDWKRVVDFSTVNPPEGVPLSIRDVEGPIAVHFVAFEASSARVPGNSSIAASIFRANDVLFQDVDFIAGNGATGKAGEQAENPAWPALVATDARSMDVPANCEAVKACTGFASREVRSGCRLISTGASAQSVLCPDGRYVKGGDGARGANCGMGLPQPGTAQAGKPGSSNPTGIGELGRDGASGAASTAFGAIDDGVYMPASGLEGSWGEPGTAGHGGDGSGTYYADVSIIRYVIGGGGGQGGYPGCGGPPGHGGGGGGASFGVLVQESTVRIDGGRIVTGRGGDGGAPSPGRAGHDGGMGGLGARGENLEAGEDGMPGGNGGVGGTGGPGAGGPSIGVVFVGTKPIVENALFELSTAGLGATGATQAPDGLRAKTYLVGSE